MQELPGLLTAQLLVAYVRGLWVLRGPADPKGPHRAHRGADEVGARGHRVEQDGPPGAVPGVEPLGERRHLPERGFRLENVSGRGLEVDGVHAVRAVELVVLFVVLRTRAHP